MRKAEMQSWEQLFEAELASADALDAEEIAIDSAWHEVSCGHAQYRWELDPAWADDYVERYGGAFPSMKWRHFGH